MSWLYTTPIVVLTVLIVGCLLGALELGHRLGSVAPVVEQQTTTIAAPILALVGLLLAFSFSMAGSRHAQRRTAAVQEANSIGTFWLRTSLAPEPTRAAMRKCVRRYVDLHFEHRRAILEQAQTTELETEAGRLQRELWALLIEDARREPEASRVRLLTPALNSMFDDTASLLAARENRIPDAIFLYLFVLVIISGLVVGYRPDSEKRNLILWAMFTVVVSGVLVILLDMDRPRRGLIQTDAAPYERLRASMQQDPP
jgi:hypothetical protein